MEAFSIVIPTYNRLSMLKQSLNSIWQQTYTNYEVIVVDDGSTDGTQEYLQSLGDRVSMLTQSNRGPGAARNLGINQARGDYVAFLDSDDLWFPWTLKTYSEVIWKSGCPSFIAGKPAIFMSEAELSNLAYTDTTFNEFRDYLSSGDEWRWWGVSSFVINKNILKVSGGFVEINMNGEDADLALKLGDAPGFVQIKTPYTFAYRDHPANVTKNLTKTLSGIWYKLNMELSSGYPGGAVRAKERWRILTRHIRPVTLDCLKQNQNAEAWKLYWATFRWHLLLGRRKFLIGFPIKAIFGK